MVMMFPLVPTRSSSSSSSASSCASGSPTPSLSPCGWNPSRPTISPPGITPETPSSATTKSSMYESPFLQSFDLSATPHRHCAYPSWPARATLGQDITTSPTGYYAGNAFDATPLPSSRISNEDLESLDFSSAPATKRCGEDDDAALFLNGSSGAVAAAGLGISWSAVGNGNVPSVGARVPERRRRLPPPPVQVRRRSSSRGVKRKSRAAALGPIAE